MAPHAVYLCKNNVYSWSDSATHVSIISMTVTTIAGFYVSHELCMYIGG
jgi:hypothetical protein